MKLEKPRLSNRADASLFWGRRRVRNRLGCGSGCRQRVRSFTACLQGDTLVLRARLCTEQRGGEKERGSDYSAHDLFSRRSRVTITTIKLIRYVCQIDLEKHLI